MVALLVGGWMDSNGNISKSVNYFVKRTFKDFFNQLKKKTKVNKRLGCTSCTNEASYFLDVVQLRIESENQIRKRERVANAGEGS